MANELQLHGIEKRIKITPYEHRTRYHETDQQGIIHHSNYIKWMEDARMNLMEQLGLGNQQMQAANIISPVISLSIDYRSTAKFDETIVIATKLTAYDGYNMEIAYKMYEKESGETRAVAKSKHCFLNKSGIPISLKRTYPELDTKFFEFK